MSLIGSMASMEKTIPLGRLHMRPLQWFLKTHRRYPQFLDIPVPVSQVLKQHLQWWTNLSNLRRGSPLHQKECNFLLFTDASLKGWGAHLEHHTASGLWNQVESRLHINILELKAVFLALKSFENQLLNQNLLISTDNSSVVAYLNKQGGTHSQEMCALIWRIMAWTNARGIQIRAKHIPGNLNVLADSLSKKDKVIQTEWALNHRVFNQICHCWHQPMVDLFATKLNHKLPMYVSPVPDGRAWETDALNISWEGLDAYVFCPVALIPQVIQKLTTYRCRIIMIAPGWPGMSWFWDLVDLSTRLPLRLPLWVDLLTQPFSNRLRNNLTYLNLHAWHLESVLKVQEDSQRRWQSELRSLSNTLRGESMNQGGPYLGSGVRRVRWTSQIPLFQT